MIMSILLENKVYVLREINANTKSMGLSKNL